MKIIDIIEKYKLEANITLVGFHVGDEWKHDLWNVELRRWSFRMETTYKTGTGLRLNRGPDLAQPGVHIKHPLAESFFVEKGRRFTAQAPKLADVLDCLRSDAAAIEQSYEEFCDEFGHDPDSRKVLMTYEACLDSARQLCRLLGVAGLAELLGCEVE